MKKEKWNRTRSFVESHKNNAFLIILIAVVLLGSVSFYRPAKSTLNPSTSSVLLTLPQTSDWTNQGIAISQGAEGEWDRYLWGGFANSLIKKDGVYYLYYQGSPSYDEGCDDNAYRAIGVATSTDGINWTKYPGNPIITWVDQGAPTEGAVSSAAILGSDGNVYLYYGANSGSVCLINSGGRLAQSSDGLNFTDQGEVIANAPPLWGNGDEIFPVGGYLQGDTWNIYYVPNGVPQTKRLGVISGTEATIFDPQSSSGVNNSALSAWGPLSVVSDGVTSYAFVNDPAKNKPVKVYSFDPNIPDSMTLRQTYVFPDCFQASVLYEAGNNRWLMLCRDKAGSQFYRVKTVLSIAPTPTPTPVVATPTPGGGTPTPTRKPTPNPTPTP